MTVTFEGKKYVLVTEPVFTNALLGNNFKNYSEVNVGEEYHTEMSAGAVSQGKMYMVFWIFTFVKLNEPEDLSDLSFENPYKVKSL
jgi:hypothetical protein